MINGTKLTEIYEIMLPAVMALMEDDRKQADIWMNTKMEIFDGETPLEHASTTAGLQDVFDLIGRLQNGVFS